MTLGGSGEGEPYEKDRQETEHCDIWIQPISRVFFVGCMEMCDVPDR